MNTRYLIGILLLAAILVGCTQAPTGQVVPPENEQEHAPTERQTETDLPGEPDVTFRMTGTNFRFHMDGQENPELRVRQGDLVRIEFESTEGFHDWVVDEFGAATAQVRPGTPTFVEFTAGEPGTYEYYCSVGSHRENGMRGALIVE